MFFRSLALELIRSDVDVDSIIICNFMYYFEYFENIYSTSKVLD